MRFALAATVLASASLANGCASLSSRDSVQADAPARGFTALQTSGFTGDLAIARPDEADVIFYGSSGDNTSSRTLEGWPWASVTKQVIAVLVMREIESNRLSLDSEIGEWVPRLSGRGLTVEKLLRHQSDLPNPDDTPTDARGSSSFYTGDGNKLAYCTHGTSSAQANGEWSYNNCDYIVLGEMLEKLTGSSLDLLLAQGIGLEAGWMNTSFLAPSDEREFAFRTAGNTRELAGYGASGALVGPLDDMIAFDRALNEGALLNADSLDALWQGDPALGQMALGQWVFEAPLTGCNAPVRIVERHGEIGNYQVRNVILPDRDIYLALATYQTNYEFGEIWTGSGPLHDLLSTVACD